MSFSGGLNLICLSVIVHFSESKEPSTSYLLSKADVFTKQILDLWMGHIYAESMYVKVSRHKQALSVHSYNNQNESFSSH